MGNTVKKQERKRRERANLEYYRKKQDTVCLLIGNTGSGKTEFIKQALQCDIANIDINDKNLYKLTYNFSSFTINEYSSSIDRSSQQYKYLNNIMNRINGTKLNIDAQDPDSEQLIILLIYGYCNRNINNDIANIIIRYHTLHSMITSYRFGAGNNNWELWDNQIYDDYILGKLYNYCKTILFMVDISGYNEYIENNCNKLSNDFDLFKRVVQPRRRSETVLFLNKSDLFAEKIKTIPLSECDLFTDFDCKYDGLELYEKSIQEIQNKFANASLANPDPSRLFVHVTCANDKDKTMRLFDLVRLQYSFKI